MIKALIFDCWGTVFTNTQTPHPFVSFAKRLGYDIADRSFLKIFEQYLMINDDSVSNHIISLLSELNIESSSDLVHELTSIIMGSLQSQITYDDSVETLNKFKKRYRLILLSNTFHEGFENLQSRYPVDDWFELQVLSYKEHLIKPNETLYARILNQSGLQKEEVLMIGDNYDDDVLPANQVGIQSILLDRRGRYPEIIENKVHDLNELAALIESK
jgi:putative hydrolase of the HAD superfamily